MRVKYWNNTKFADWLRGTPSLTAGTSEEWAEWEQQARVKKIRYWLAEDFLDFAQNVWCWIPDRINNIRYYLNNRFTVRTHAMTSTLPRGQWHEFDTRLLHCSFDTLVDFVEIEQAWHHVLWSDEDRKKFQTPWWRQHWWSRWFMQWRSPEAGKAYLDWASSLTIGEDWGVEPGDATYGNPTSQAIAARETWALYYWWKYVRPRRVDPYDYSGWTELCARRREGDNRGIWAIMNDRTNEEREESARILKICDNLEISYNAEDEEMLIRLVKLRNSLWT